MIQFVILNMAFEYVNQADESPEDMPPDQSELISSSVNSDTNSILKVEAQRTAKPGDCRRTSTYVPIIVLMLSILAAHLFHHHLAAINPSES